MWTMYYMVIFWYLNIPVYLLYNHFLDESLKLIAPSGLNYPFFRTKVRLPYNAPSIYHK